MGPDVLALSLLLLAVDTATAGPLYDQIEHPLPELRYCQPQRHRKAIEQLYRSNGYQPIWSRGSGPTQQALALAKHLAAATEKGLKPADYASHPDEVDFTACVLRYLSDLRYGRVNPHDLKLGLAVDEDDGMLAALVSQLAIADDIEQPLASVEPPFPIYSRTLKALQKYRALATEEFAPLPLPKKPIAPEAWPELQHLSQRLALLDDLDSPDLGAGLKHFQSRHGLSPTGLVDAATVRELNVPPSRRAVQLELLLERLRWMPHEFPVPPLIVNIPEFVLHATDANHHGVFTMKVVVGRAWRHETPIFAGMMNEIVFQPYWNVPRNIAVQELIPELEKDPGTMERNQYELVDRNSAVVTAGAPDASMLEGLRTGSLRIRQRPGAHNALGPVKFLFPNAYAVYLHGTPSPKLFERDRRDFSHGCIRLEDPQKLAQWILQGDPAWPADRIREAMSGGARQSVKVAPPVPVLIVYSTGLVTEDGQVRFFPDIYGQDATLEHALAK
jgi:L,D-transpeptidase YcbB